MIKKAALLAMVSVFGTAAAAAPKSKAKVLKPGEYTATAKALVCSGCAPQIEETLKRFPGVEQVSVDPESAGVRFKVSKGASVKLNELQKSLKAGSDKMGMGADYTLRDVKPAPAKAAAEAGKTSYACPTDGRTSDKPGKCPKCGMALEKRTK